MLGYSGKTSKLDESSWEIIELGDTLFYYYLVILTLKLYSAGNFHLVGALTRLNRAA